MLTGMMRLMEIIALAIGRFVRLSIRLRRLPDNQAGSVMLLVALAAIPLVGFVGVGTDTARGYLVRSRLSSALDAAALAGGHSFFLTTRDADVKMYFDANFPTGYLDATVAGPTIAIDQAAETITLTASATIPTTFMRLFGYNDLTVDASAEVTRAQEALDVVLAIDMSGSMGSSVAGGGSRLAAARNAASLLVNVLYGSSATKDRLNIGVVPWNGKVNITLNGSTFDPAATLSNLTGVFVNPETGAVQSNVFVANNSPVPLLAKPDDDWKGCVFSRFLNDGNNTTDADLLLSPTSVGGVDWPAWQPIGPEGEPVSGGTCAMSVNGGECTRCLSAGITPLNNTKQTVLDAVASLTTPTGTTNIPQGLGWAWRVLKPTSPFTEALLNPPYKRQQAIVLLTDGENFGGNGDGYKTVFGYGSAARPTMDARLLTLAGNIKADGVAIYVIQFANSGSSLQTLLSQVATAPTPPYYHNAPDAATLENIFREIANHLSKLRISK